MVGASAVGAAEGATTVGAGRGDAVRPAAADPAGPDMASWQPARSRATAMSAADFILGDLPLLG
jgi:hypothetical protein